MLSLPFHPNTPAKTETGSVLTSSNSLLYSALHAKSDELCVSDYLDGDDNALAHLVERYLQDVYRFALGLTKNSQAADDITQESFIKAWKHIRRYRRGSNFRTWLFAIARNTAIDWLRHKKELPLSSFESVENPGGIIESIADAAPLPDELLAHAENTVFVQALLETLDPRYKDVLTLRYTSNYTFEEIGEVLKRPLHTVKSQHRRALAMLRRALQAYPA